MKHRFRSLNAIIIGGFLLSILQVTILGQYYQEREDDEEGPGVILYKHADFRGSHTFVEAGRNIKNLRRIGWNDKISSIELVDDVYIRIFEHANYQGASVTIRRDIIDLAEFGKGIGGSWNDKISSIKVYYGSGYDDDGYGRRACVFFKHSNRRGSSYDGHMGRHRKISSHWNDEISSVWIRSGYKLTIYEHKNFNGKRLTLYGKGRRGGSLYNLGDYRFNDKMSSYKLERTRRRRR